MTDGLSRFVSVRSPNRPKPLSRRASLATFRDESRFMAVSYDKMVAAEPPTLMTSRRSSRASRTSRPTSSSNSPTLIPSPQSSQHRPIVVIPPTSLRKPPTEQHPALRETLPSKSSGSEAGKRDSGHASSSSSPSPPSCPIQEEDGEGQKKSSGDHGFSFVTTRKPADPYVDDSAASSLPVRQGAVPSAVAASPTLSWAEGRKTSASIYSYRSSIDSVKPTTPKRRTMAEAEGLAISQSGTSKPCGVSNSPSPSAIDEQCLSNGVGQTLTTLSAPAGIAASPVANQSPSSHFPLFGSPKAGGVGRSFSLRKFSFASSSCSSSTTVNSASPPRERGRKSIDRHVRNSFDEVIKTEAFEKKNKTTLLPALMSENTATMMMTGSTASAAGRGSTLPGRGSLPAPASAGAGLDPPTTLPSSPPSRSPGRGSSRFWLGRSHLSERKGSRPQPETASSTSSRLDQFSPLSIDIPTDDLLDHEFLNDITFSKRGSIMLAGRRFPLINKPKIDVESTEDVVATAAGNNTRSSHEEQPRLDDKLVNGTHSRQTSDDDATSPLTTTSATIPPTASTAGAATTAAITTMAPKDVPHEGTAEDNHPPQDDITEQPPVKTTSAEDENPNSSPPPSTTEPPIKTQLRIPDNQRLKPPPLSFHGLAADMEMESQKVRSLYAVGDAIRWEDGAPSNGASLQGALAAPALETGANDVSLQSSAPGSIASKSARSSVYTPVERRTSRDPVIGSLEDWDDLDGAEVDRYGFITAPRPSSSRLATPTDLKSSQFNPRRGRNILRKRESGHYSSALGRRPPSRKVSARSLNTVNSEVSFLSVRSTRSVLRQAGNLLPHNKERRWMDEAGDMLTTAPSLQDVAEEARISKITDSLKKKEIERTEKWRRMAKSIKGEHGRGMEFEFDVKNPKLIERTWKGIPDRWRSAAWWSFMATSAKNHPGSPTEATLIEDFHRLQTLASPDDVQIDLDVPRTISRHIMFRRRYQGGQRLLFRVLHALSIYFPQTGYVQGMASLAATMLSYFDEEKTFVMLVRMWDLRGLDRLYRPGFEGLMAALKEFENIWMNKDVAKRMAELCVDPTAYGTRWYLTLFNLSIPFPAQLRVWDVFLLLGDEGLGQAPEAAVAKSASNGSGSGSIANNNSNNNSTTAKAGAEPVTTGLDVLHASAAALVQALREVLLDSDFENAMKALTSFIPVKDEELLMRVAKAEWKLSQGKKKT